MRSQTCSGKGILSLTHNSGHYVWGELEVKGLMNSLLKNVVFDKKLNLGDAARPHLKEVFTLTIRSIGYGKVPWYSWVSGM